MTRPVLICFASLLISVSAGSQNAYDEVLRATVLNNQGRYSDCIKAATPAISLYPDARLYVLRGEAYLRTGELKKAIDDFTNAETIRPGAGTYGLSKVYAIEGNISEALRNLEKNMHSEYKEEEKLILTESAFERIENTPQWRQFWKNEWYTGAEKDLSGLEYSLSAGRKDEAANLIKEISYNHRGTEVEFYALALRDYSSGLYSEALKAAIELVKINSSNGKYLDLLAAIQTGLANYAGATQTLQKMVAMEVPDPEILIRLSFCYMKTGELRRASENINRLLALSPDNKKGIQLAGRIASASGDHLKALELYSRNIEYHPGDAECYTDRAGAYFVSTSWQYSISDYSMALDLNPGDTEAWLNKGIALINTGKADDGCLDLQRAYSMGSKRAAEMIGKYCIR